MKKIDTVTKMLLVVVLIVGIFIKLVVLMGVVVLIGGDPEEEVEVKVQKEPSAVGNFTLVIINKVGNSVMVEVEVSKIKIWWGVIKEGGGREINVTVYRLQPDYHVVVWWKLYNTGEKEFEQEGVRIGDIKIIYLMEGNLNYGNEIEDEEEEELWEDIT
jgi:hypothetical protein